MQTTGLSIQEASRSCNHQQRLFYKVLNKVFNTYSLCHFTLFIMTQLVYLNVLISLYEFNICLDGYIWWKFCVNSPLRNPLTDKNADVSNTYFPRCIYITHETSYVNKESLQRPRRQRAHPVFFLYCTKAHCFVITIHK